jgi:FtsZ-binding cell division protein ZapB
MNAPQQEERSPLEDLESRIMLAVETVGRLKEERKELEARLRSALEEKEVVSRALALAREEVERLTRELDGVRSERKQVRGRIEKLLGQLDLISAE